MTQQQIDSERIQFRLTIAKIISLILSSSAICFSIAFYVNKIENELQRHEDAIAAQAQRISDVKSDIAELRQKTYK